MSHGAASSRALVKVCGWFYTNAAGIDSHCYERVHTVTVSLRLHNSV